jgi:hypothetical protein
MGGDVIGGTLVDHEAWNYHPWMALLEASANRAHYDINGRGTLTGQYLALKWCCRQVWKWCCRQVCEESARCKWHEWWQPSRGYKAQGMSCSSKTIAADARRYLEWLKEMWGDGG